MDKAVAEFDRVAVLNVGLPPYSMVVPYLREMDEARRYSNFGPLSRRLEERHAQRLGVDPERVVATSSGTGALVATISCLCPSRVVVPAWTFVATACAALASGVPTTVVDVDPTTWEMTLSGGGIYESRPNDLLLPVAPFGAAPATGPAPDGRSVVWDAAASLTNTCLKAPTGGAGVSAAFSLHATKLLGCGEGGLVVAESVALANDIRRYCNFGLDETRTPGGPGSNYKMSEISAAYGLAALDSWGDEAPRWQRALDNLAQVVGCALTKGTNWRAQWIAPYFNIQLPQQDKADDLISTLERSGIEARRWWPSTMDELVEGDLVRNTESRYPTAKHLCETVVGLPVRPDLQGEALESFLVRLSNGLSEVLD